jgi:hypothetical protein
MKQPQQPKFKEVELLKQKQVQEQVQKTKDIFDNPPLNPPRNKPPEIEIGKPRIPPKPPFKPSDKSIRSKQNIELLSKAFSVFMRSKGKVQEIGKGLTYGEALKLGVKSTKGSLAQTFALKESGLTKKRDIGYKLPSELFTTPKRQKTRITELTFVERRGKTLTHYPEVKGLQQARRSKSKLKWL